MRDKACIAPVIITEDEVYFIKKGSILKVGESQ
jgi:TusA-related sulfurtransferase